MHLLPSMPFIAWRVLSPKITRDGFRIECGLGECGQDGVMKVGEVIVMMKPGG